MLLAVAESPSMHDHCDLVPSSPARPVSLARHDYTSRTASTSPTASYPPRVDPIENDGDIGICLTPCTQPTEHNPYDLGSSSKAVCVTSAPCDCMTSITGASLTFPEPTPAMHIPAALRVCPSLAMLSPTPPPPVVEPSSPSSVGFSSPSAHTCTSPPHSTLDAAYLPP